MLGYVQIYKPELKVREYDVYQGYYCGICKYIGENFGQLPRAALSYDAAFLALMLACISDAKDNIKWEHCVVHPMAKRSVISNDAIAYAGDVMLLLAWYKLEDDARDDGSVKAKAAMLTMKKKFKEISRRHSGLCLEIENRLKELHELEEAKCESLDQVCEPFALIMRAIFSQGAKLLHKKRMGEEFAALHQSFANIGYHLGKWIYLMDAADDISENLEKGSYNPLLYRYGYETIETGEEFYDRIKEKVSFNLFHYLAVISQLVDRMDIKKNKGIIDNIIYFGLNRKTEEVLKGKTVDESDDKENDDESI